MGHFSIKVLNGSGNPKSGVKVSVFFGTWNCNDSSYTDENGWVEFSNLDGDLVTAELYIDGENKGDISTYSGDTYSFTID